jgi:hypothetical protein
MKEGYGEAALIMASLLLNASNFYWKPKISKDLSI